LSEAIPGLEAIEKAYQSLRERAKASTDRDELELALSLYQEALDLKPIDADAIVNLGNAYQRLDQYGDAEKQYQAALAYNPHSWRALNNLGIIHKDRKQWDLAIHFYEKAIAADNRKAPAFANLGNLYVDQKEFEKAEVFYKKAAELEPDDFLTQYNLGVFYRDLKRYQEALDILLKLDAPENLKKHHLAAIVRSYKGLKAWDKTTESLKLYLEVDPQSEWGHYEIGRLYYRLKDFYKAVEHLEKAIVLYQNQPSTHYKPINTYLKLLDVYKELENWKGIKKYSADYLERYGPDADIFHARGELYYHLKQFDLAELEIKKALELQPKTEIFIFTLSNVYHSKGDFESRLRCFDELIQYYPNESRNYLWRAITLQHLARRDEEEKDYLEKSLESLQKAMVLKPGCWSHYYNQGNVLFDMQRYDEALASYEKAIELDSQFGTSFFGAEKCLKAMGQNEKAEEYCKKGEQCVEFDWELVEM
jgi:tetratricopeptide (TPR) repeat protein